MLGTVRTPDIRLLRVFITVVESGGFSEAQISLNVGQSTISTQMADLEKRLGMNLCRRGRAGFALTEDGREVYDAAKRLFSSIDQFVQRINDRKGGLSGELSIAIADAVVANSDFRLSEAIANFREKAPDVNLAITTANPLDIEHGIMEERFHIGVHSFPSHAPGIVYQPLFSEEQTLYCGDLHPLFGRTEGLTKADLEAAPYVRRTYYGGALQTGAFRPNNIAANAGSMEATMALVFSGKFVAHLPTRWAAQWIDKGLLQALLPDQTCYTVRFEMVVQTGTQRTSIIEAFVRELNQVHGIEEMRRPASS
jgi:DNA-binding transcriptional LysR family regulator